jgi:hypothetical protein
MTTAVNPEPGRFLLLQLSPTLARWGFKLLMPLGFSENFGCGLILLLKPRGGDTEAETT